MGRCMTRRSYRLDTTASKDKSVASCLMRMKAKEQLVIRRSSRQNRIVKKAKQRVTCKMLGKLRELVKRK